MKTFRVTSEWRAIDTIEVSDDEAEEIQKNPGTLGEWAEQIDANGAELIDWDIKEVEL